MNANIVGVSVANMPRAGSSVRNDHTSSSQDKRCAAGESLPRNLVGPRLELGRKRSIGRLTVDANPSPQTPNVLGREAPVDDYFEEAIPRGWNVFGDLLFSFVGCRFRTKDLRGHSEDSFHLPRLRTTRDRGVFS